MKYVIILYLVVFETMLAQNSLNQTKRGNSIFAPWENRVHTCEVEKPNGNDEELCLYRMDGTNRELILTIQSVWNKRIRYPLFVDLFETEKFITILLEIQSPYSFFLVQKYSKEDANLRLIAEYPIQKMNILKNQKLVAAKIESIDRVVFYFLPREERFRTKRADGIDRMRGIALEEDIRVTYDFLNTGTLMNGEKYDFNSDDSKYPIEGY